MTSIIEEPKEPRRILNFCEYCLQDGTATYRVCNCCFQQEIVSVDDALCFISKLVELILQKDLGKQSILLKILLKILLSNPLHVAVETKSEQYSGTNKKYQDRQTDLSIQRLASESFKQAGHQISQSGLQAQNNHNKLTLKYFSIVCGVRQQS